VPPTSSGEQEERTRVTCHLPIKNAAEEKAFKEIIAYLDRPPTPSALKKRPGACSVQRMVRR